jgi:hypothetical protein
VDVSNEYLLVAVQCPQEGGLLAVSGIDPDPFEPHPASPRLAHNVQRMLAFRGQLARVRRNPGLIAARWILDPTLRQIQPHVDRSVALAIRQHTEHRDLTVVHLAQAPRPLPSDADRAISFPWVKPEGMAWRSCSRR